MLSGEVIRKEVDVEGERKVRFVQLDKETNSLMHRNVASIPIETELQTRDKVKDIELGANQKEALQLSLIHILLGNAPNTPFLYDL